MSRVRALSKKCKYALLALQALARAQGEGPVLISEIARRENIPPKFLEGILLELRNQGILQSKKGKGGGYHLRKAAAEITLGEVIRAFDGPLAPQPCATESARSVKCDECADDATCGLRTVMKEVRDATAHVLDGTTIADLLKRVDRLTRERKQKPMYYI